MIFLIKNRNKLWWPIFGIVTIIIFFPIKNDGNFFHSIVDFSTGNTFDPLGIGLCVFWSIILFKLVYDILSTIKPSIVTSPNHGLYNIATIRTDLLKDHTAKAYNQQSLLLIKGLNISESPTQPTVTSHQRGSSITELYNDQGEKEEKSPPKTGLVTEELKPSSIKPKGKLATIDTSLKVSGESFIPEDKKSKLIERFRKQKTTNS